jgi:hypothetical protein
VLWDINHGFRPGLRLIFEPVSLKFYTRFVADLGRDGPSHGGPSEYTGIVELTTCDVVPTDPQRIAVLLARDLDLDAEEIRVLQWARLH